MANTGGGARWLCSADVAQLRLSYPPALTDPLHSFLLLLWSIVWLEKYTFNAFAIDSIRKVGIAGRCNCKERRLEID